MFCAPPDETDPEELALLCSELAPFVGDQRRPELWTMDLNGITFHLELRPHGRDVRLWNVYRDGAPWLAAVGHEKVWRAMQADAPPPLGRKHWANTYS